MSKFNVEDMMNEYADDNGIDVGDIFKKEEPKKEEKRPVKAKPGEWRPDSSVTEGMDEFKSSAVAYNKEDVQLTERELENGADKELQNNVKENFSDLGLKTANIEEAKKRHGIVKLQVPPGELQVRMLIAAGSHNHAEAQDLLDQLLNEIETTYPEMILERVGQQPVAPQPQKVAPEVPKQETVQVAPKKEAASEVMEGVDTPAEPVKAPTPSISSDGEDVKVVIDKHNVNQIVWSAEEAAKIRKSRTLELNIVDGKNLEFGSIEDVQDNAVDAILSTYQRKTNDIAAPLPASKYRATFSGLTYPEIIDLSSANQINNLDAEREKWSIVYKHMRNVSIGPWEEYILYIDPETNSEVRLSMDDTIPANIPDKNIHPVSKFEDFLRKTSYIDLDYCLWKILCATAMDKEVISIDCHSEVNGAKCNNTYDWIYSPNELLNIESINPSVLQEMEDTSTASSLEECIKIYNSSFVRSNNFVELASSGFRVVYGHASAYEYLEEIYPKITGLKDSQKPEDVSKFMNYSLILSLKFVLVPNQNGGWIRIKGVDNLEKVLSTLDSIDYETLTELSKMVTGPYQFQYAMQGIVCPKCKNRSMIPITNMERLLFIVARSLSSVNITLKSI